MNIQTIKTQGHAAGRDIAQTLIGEFNDAIPMTQQQMTEVTQRAAVLLGRKALEVMFRERLTNEQTRIYLLAARDGFKERTAEHATSLSDLADIVEEAVGTRH